MRKTENKTAFPKMLTVIFFRSLKSLRFGIFIF